MGAVTVTVYTRADCPACLLTKRHLARRGVEFVEADLREVVDAARARGIVSAPVVTAGSQMWGGYRPDRIDALVPA